ncbi:FAD-dependent oxidoreductase, partial [Patescibacteria group bacterium]|nr:FAD-dependent oxidoreductase [Patescibacteria group bacterium]
MSIGIIGGGLTGLTAAYELGKRGHRVTVFEKGKTLGGLAGGFTMPTWDWSLEFFYHHFFTNDYVLINLAKELGLEKEMLILQPITSTLCKNLESGIQNSDSDAYSGGTRRGTPVDHPQSRNLVVRTLYNLEKMFMWSKDVHKNLEQCGVRMSDGGKRVTGPELNNIFQLDSPMNLLTFPLLSPVDKLQTGTLLAFCKMNPFWQPLENVTAKQFFQTIGGTSAWEILWHPLLAGKFGSYADQVPASWLWARIKKRTSSLGYFRAGFQTFVDRLAEAIKKQGGNIFTNTAVISIHQKTENRKRKADFSLSFSALRPLPSVFDAILITTPSSVAMKLIQFPKLYESKLRAIPHLWAQTLILETKQPILKKTYWLNVANPSFPFIAVVSHTNFMDKKHYGGNHITYIGNYLPEGHPYLTFTPKQLLKGFTPFIQKINPSFRPPPSAFCFLFSAPSAQPVHTLNYSKKAPEIKTPVEGIYLANLDSIYPWDRGINYAV